MQVLAQFSQGDVLGKRTAEALAAPPAATPANVVAAASTPAAAPAPASDIPPIPIYPNDPSKTRVLFCGTYPIGQSNGYSRVVYYIAKHLGKHAEDLQVTIYGFQNYKQTAGSDARNDIPASVRLHDALAHENPRRNGFGELEIGKFLKLNQQDIVIVFNDLVITTSLTQTIVKELTPEERKSFKLVSYLDQTTPYQKKHFIDVLNTYFDAVITFTDYWKEVVTKQLKLKPSIPVYVFPHGFDHELYYPIDKKYARMYHNLPQDAFIVLQLNRNQPRKRLDHCMMAWAGVVEKHIQAKKAQPLKQWRPMKLMIGTSMSGFWDLNEIFEHELSLRNIPAEIAREYITNVQKPQQLSDRDINILYNACDVSLSTVTGAGFELISFESLALGVANVAPNIGGHKHYMHAKNALLIEPKIDFYVDKTVDAISGRGQISDPKDFTEALWKYYTQPALAAKHAATGRKEILTHYRWETVIDFFVHNIINKIVPKK